MEYQIHCVAQSLAGYLRELIVPVLLGFLLSGLIHEFIPFRFVQKYLGDNSVKAIFTATWIGALLPVCCMGSLPIAVTLRQKGARLGPVLAFLVATPATSATALFMTWKLMGFSYTMYLALVVIVLGLIIGLIGNCVAVPVEQSAPASKPSCCHEDAHGEESHDHKPSLINALQFGLIDLPKEIGLQLVIGAVVASVIVGLEPVRHFVQTGLNGFKGYLILVGIGLVDYVCSTGSVPVANALMQSGVTAGKSIVYLLLGPITSYGTLLVIRQEFGWRVLWIYLAVIIAGSVASGVAYDVWRQNFPG